MSRGFRKLSPAMHLVKKKSPLSMFKKNFGALGARVHNSWLMVLSIEPFFRTSPPQFWGALLTPPSLFENPAFPVMDPVAES